MLKGFDQINLAVAFAPALRTTGLHP
eukprot:SAG31_NODE_23021_length_513_cov_0.777778_1_plen_25_part_10